MGEKISCIYKISSIKNGKIYIGSAFNFSRRKYLHIWELKRLKHINQKLQRHFNKYGLDDLVFEIIEVVEDKANLISREQHYIDTLNPWFNICKVAGNCAGRIASPETCMKITKSNLGKKAWNKGLKMGPAWNKGKTNTPEHRAKISKANTGHIKTPETRKKLSDGWTEKSSRKGSKLTEDQLNNRLKMFAEKRALKGLPPKIISKEPYIRPPMSEETKAKIREARKKQTPPTLGMKLPKSDKCKKLISDGLKRYFENKKQA